MMGYSGVSFPLRLCSLTQMADPLHRVVSSSSSSSPSPLQLHSLPAQECNGTLHLLHPYSARGMGNLPMQIRHFDLISIHEAQCPDPRASEIRRGRTTQASCADQEDLGGPQPELCWLCVSGRPSLVF